MNVPAALSFLRNGAWFMAGLAFTSSLFAFVLDQRGWCILFWITVWLFILIACDADREISRRPERK